MGHTHHPLNFARAKPNQAVHKHPLILKAKICANEHPNQDDRNKQRHTK